MKKKLVIGIVGQARHGKDVTCSILVHSCPYNTEHLSFAALLKEQAKQLGWDGKKDEAGRTFLQELSVPIKKYFSEKAKINEADKSVSNGNYYSSYILNKIKKDTCENKVFFITDLRFMHEYERFKEQEDIELVVIKVIRLNQDGDLFDNGLTDSQKLDKSETDHLLMNCDYTVVTESKEELENKLSLIKDELWKKMR